MINVDFDPAATHWTGLVPIVALLSLIVTWAHEGTATPSGIGHLLLEHPAVGELDLHFHRFQPESCPDQFLITLHADPESPSEGGLRLLKDFAPPE